jgi:hypothetical protein
MEQRRAEEKDRIGGDGLEQFAQGEHAVIGEGGRADAG